MNEIFTILNQPLPVGLVLIIGIVVLWFRLSDLKQSVKDMKSQCVNRYKWCIEHFEQKQK